MGKKLLMILLALGLLALPMMARAEDGCCYWCGFFTLFGDAELSGNLDITAQAMGVADLEADLALVLTKVKIGGKIPVKGYVKALTKNDQFNMFNSVNNIENSNTAVVDGQTLKNAKGHIGLNMVAGDFNAQSNVSSIAYGKAGRSLTNAKIFSVQKAMWNYTLNKGMTNSASVGGEALKNAKGKIGLNVAAGTDNAQSNLLAIAVAPAKVAQATAYVQQKSMFNSTSNVPVKVQEVKYYPVYLRMYASGTAGGTWFSGGYSGSEGGTVSGDVTGMSYQASNFYPDTWKLNPSYGPHDQHPHSPKQIGHLDMDVQTQGAIDNPFREGVGGLAFDNDNTLNGEYSGSESGSLWGGIGAQSINLSGCVYGSIPVVVTKNINTKNIARLSGQALMNAKGDIGVNIAAGTNNLQANALSISYIPAPAPAPTPGGGAEQ